MKKMKYCTNCGVQLLDKNNQPAFELYDEELHKKSNILKVMSCSKCGQVADKYIECDRVLLLIDLILMNKQAYRHVLFNGGYQSLIIRMALLTLICDAYISWAQSAEAGEFFEKEYEFYVMCLKLFIALSTFLLLVLIPCLRASQCSKLALGLLLSYCSRFCNLIALLWAPKSEGQTSNVFASIASPEVMWSFIIILFFISSVRVYQVTLGARLITSIFHLLLGHLGFYGVLLNSDYFIDDQNIISFVPNNVIHSASE